MIGGSVPSFSELEQDSCSLQLWCNLIDQTLPSSIKEDTYIVVANATAKKVNEQDTKTFPNGYVGRNGKQSQQKLCIQVCRLPITQRNQGCHD